MNTKKTKRVLSPKNKQTSVLKTYTVLLVNNLGYEYIRAKNMTDAIRKLIKGGRYDISQKFQLEIREGNWSFIWSKGKLQFPKKFNKLTKTNKDV
jgi:hypothetical protein